MSASSAGKVSQSAPIRRSGVRIVGLIAILAAGGLAGLGGRTWLQGRDLRLARAAVQQGQLEIATAAYQRHLQRSPRDDSIRLELATMLQYRDPEAALHQLRAISRHAAEFPDAARLTAAIAIEQGRDYDAIGPLVFLEERLPDDASIQLALAEVRFRQRDYEAALRHARRRRELLPSEVDACLLIAEALDELKRPAEMVEPLEAALMIDPELPQAHLNLAYALQSIGKSEQALEHAQWFLARHPDTAAAHRLLAQIERSRGNPDAALAAVERALQLQPRNLDAALLEAELLLFLRQPDRAYHRLQEFAEHVGTERRLLALQLQAAALSGRTEEARQLQSRLNRLSSVE